MGKIKQASYATDERCEPLNVKSHRCKRQTSTRRVGYNLYEIYEALPHLNDARK